MLSFFLLFCMGLVALCSVGLPPLHWVIMTLKDYKVTKGEKHQIPSLAHGELSSLWVCGQLPFSGKDEVLMRLQTCNRKLHKMVVWIALKGNNAAGRLEWIMLENSPEIMPCSFLWERSITKDALNVAQHVLVTAAVVLMWNSTFSSAWLNSLAKPWMAGMVKEWSVNAEPFCHYIFPSSVLLNSFAVLLSKLSE